MTEEIKQPYDKPDYQSPAYAQMQPAWQICSDVAAGTLHMRSKREKYLPKFPAEHKDDYEDRLKTATFFNAYNRTVGGLVGMACKKGPVLGEDVPAAIRGDEEAGVEGQVENIDLAGTHLDVFMKRVLTDAFEGHAFILVDMQQGEAANAEAEQKMGLRPYWTKYKANQAVNFIPVIINGELEIGQITFEEQVSERQGRYGSAPAYQYRTFFLEEYKDSVTGGQKYRARWELKRKVVDPKSGQVTFADAGEGVCMRGSKTGGPRVPFERIPVAVVYGQQTGFLTSQPVLLDLALINIKYYQKRSDYDASLHKAGFPIPVFIGRNTQSPQQAVGSGFGLDIPMGGEAKYMEPQGKSLEVARTDLQDVRAEMAALGLSVLSSRPEAAATATETVIDFSQESSQLETIVRSGRDALEACLSFHAAYLGEKSGGTATWGGHLRSLLLTPQQVQAYSQMVMESQLSLETLWSIMQNADALPADFDPVEEMERLFGAGASAKPAVVRKAQAENGDPPGPTEQEEEDGVPAS
jgi:hypothetical protein